MTIAVAIIFISSLLSLGLYVDGKRALQQKASDFEAQAQGVSAALSQKALLAQMDQSMLRVASVSVLAAVASLASLLVASSTWRRHFISTLEEKTQEWKSEAATLLVQVSEARRMRDQSQIAQGKIEQRLNALVAERATLQEELDRRNRADRVLAARRQELETSKSVLELHVQARTQELQKLQRRYELILNAAGEGILGFDVEGKTTFVNPAVEKITGWSMEELAGKMEAEIFGDQSQIIGDSSSGRSAGEKLFSRRDGSVFPGEYIRTAIQEDGRVVGSVLVFKDITERKASDETLTQKAAELARSNSELEQFAFVASHDLQEPLRKIQAFGDRLRGKCEGVVAPEALEYLERMQSASARMRRLIDDLLTFSRVIRNSEPFQLVDLTTLTKEVLGDLEVRIEKTGAKVEVGELPMVDADPMQMRQLFQNLIGNALKFQPPGNIPVVKITGRTVTTPAGRSCAEISIQDNGIGFDEKYVDRMFAVFQRLHGRTEYEGTGVGLAVCRRITDRHGGTIAARSKPGEGATFTVTLPAVHQKS
jgi:PAS domain S-box-containing protein